MVNSTPVPSLFTPDALKVKKHKSYNLCYPTFLSRADDQSPFWKGNVFKQEAPAAPTSPQGPTITKVGTARRAAAAAAGQGRENQLGAGEAARQAGAGGRRLPLTFWMEDFPLRRSPMSRIRGLESAPPAPPPGPPAPPPGPPGPGPPSSSASSSSSP